MKETNLYNEEAKMDFLTTISNDKTKKKLLSRFNILSKYEFEFGKDVFDFTKEELAYTVANGYFAKPSVHKENLFIIQRYLKHYQEANNYSGNISELLKITYDDLDFTKLYLQMFVKSPEDLKNKINKYIDSQISNNHKEESIYNTIKTFFWLLYLGIETSDVIFIRNDNIDLENHVIMYNNQNYQIYYYALEDIQRSMNQKYIIGGRQEYSYNVYDKNILLKSINQIKDATHGMINVHITNLNNNLKSFRFIPKDITLSGMFYRIYVNELKGSDPALASKLIVDDRFEKSSKDIKYKKLQNKRLNSDFYQMYEIWKKTFYSKNVLT